MFLKKQIIIFIIAIVLCVAVFVGCVIGFGGKKITKLDRNGYDKAFENVLGISVMQKQNRYIVTEKSSINQIAMTLNSIRLKAKPIKEGPFEEVNATNRITVNGKTFCFSKKFDKLSILDGKDTVYTYKVKNPDKAKSIFEFKDTNKTTAIVTDISVGCDIYGISAVIKNIELNGNNPLIEVEYTNNTDTDYMNGEHFDVLYKQGAGFDSCATTTLIFEDIGYFLNQGQTRSQSYDLLYFDFSKSGKYRFETEFSGQDLWIEFSLENKPENEIDSEQEAIKLQEEEIERLRKKYPQYFDLPCENGLEVYIDLLKHNLDFPTTANCRLFAGNNLNYTHGDIEEVEGVSVEEMKLILSTYKDIPKSEINVVLYYHPLSRYTSEITEGNVIQYKNKLDIYGEDEY